ncbi:M1 family metallopeptidase [Rhodohalobacter sp.]|uniref:M1 family metallopeptidase n=1 Tax=Rhodohalobacter sp. TaxID=1974210 RepID=UPI00356678B6
MIKNSLSISIFSLLFLFTLSCASTEQLDSSLESQTTESELPVSELERPLPYPIDVPNAYLQAVENGTRSTDGKPGEEYWQNYSSYTISAEIDPENHTLYGESSVEYINNSPDDLEVIVVELAQNLHKEGTPKKESTEITGGKELERVNSNGQDLEPISMLQRWTQNASGYVLDGTRLYIFPDEQLTSGGRMSFEFEWSFEIPEQGASGRMGRNRDNLYFIAYWYPKIAVYDDVYGWMDDSFLGNAEFYHGFADYELSITMPKEWMIMGTGEFLNPEETLSQRTLERYNEAGNSDDTITIADFDELSDATIQNGSESLTWKFSSNQVRDVAFSATLESRWDATRSAVGDLDGDGETDYSRINTFFRELAPLWSDQAEYAQHSISFLSDYTNLPYPWPHMTSVEGAGIIGGGMEFPMMTVIGDYNNAGAVQLYGVTAHELAHMWIPMILSTNERRYTWIDEGYTTFHTNEANKDYYGDRFDNNDIFGGYLQIAGTDLEGEMMRWSDFHYPGPAYGVASYPKPASVLAALRGVLGNELFMEAHLELIERWKYKHPYPWDIFKTIEDVTGRDLSWFWRAWYYETWTLDQAVTDVFSENNSYKIVIEDIGNVPMPVLLEITLANGEKIDQRIDVDHWLQGHRTKELTIDSNSQVVRIEIDPENHFPDVNPSNNIWEREN